MSYIWNIALSRPMVVLKFCLLGKGGQMVPGSTVYGKNSKPKNEQLRQKIKFNLHYKQQGQ